MLERRIADSVPIHIVYHLEIIQVQKNKCEGTARFLSDLFLRLHREALSIQHSRENILMYQTLQPFVRFECMEQKVHQNHQSKPQGGRSDDNIGKLPDMPSSMRHDVNPPLTLALEKSISNRICKCFRLPHRRFNLDHLSAVRPYCGVEVVIVPHGIHRVQRFDIYVRRFDQHHTISPELLLAAVADDKYGFQRHDTLAESCEIHRAIQHRLPVLSRMVRRTLYSLLLSQASEPVRGNVLRISILHSAVPDQSQSPDAVSPHRPRGRFKIFHNAVLLPDHLPQRLRSLDSVIQIILQLLSIRSCDI